MRISLRIPLLGFIALALLSSTVVRAGLPDFTSLVAESAPAVVNITATREAKVPPNQLDKLVFLLDIQGTGTENVAERTDTSAICSTSRKINEGYGLG